MQHPCAVAVYIPCSVPSKHCDPTVPMAADKGLGSMELLPAAWSQANASIYRSVQGT